jgi:hypothetical protein
MVQHRPTAGRTEDGLHEAFQLDGFQVPVGPPMRQVVPPVPAEGAPVITTGSVGPLSRARRPEHSLPGKTHRHGRRRGGRRTSVGRLKLTR